MALSLGDTAPDFMADSTEGPIHFHSWIGDSWCVLFSHPKDFTPVCTTELGYMAKIRPEFDRRNVKIVGLSVDPIDSHKTWSKDIAETQGYAPNYPMIGDPYLKVASAHPTSTSNVGAHQTDSVTDDIIIVRRTQDLPGPNVELGAMVGWLRCNKAENL